MVGSQKKRMEMEDNLISGWTMNYGLFGPAPGAGKLTDDHLEGNWASSRGK